MKKFLNYLGILGSVLLTIFLTILIFIYVLLVNVKSVVSESGITSTFSKIDFVEFLKDSNDGVMWEDFLGLASTLNLNEEQFKYILNNRKVKEELGSLVSDILGSITNDTTVIITKDRIDKLLNIAVDEYNKDSDVDITNEERKIIINSFSDEMITNINESINELNLKENIPSQNIKYMEFADSALFGDLSIQMLLYIIGIILIIGLFRWSNYKWIPYVKSSLIIVGSLLLVIGGLLLAIPLQNMDLLMPIKNILSQNILLTSIFLFIIAITLTILHKRAKKYHSNKQETINNNLESEKPEDISTSVKKDKKAVIVDKKYIIIAIIILLLVILIIYLIFGVKRGYTITFDTDGGSVVSSVEVKNGEVVNMPANPTKDGYTFAAWTDEEGKILTEGSKLSDDTKLKANWISNDADTVTVEYNFEDQSLVETILFEKGKNILLPINPTKEGYIFVGWLDNNNNIVVENLIIEKDLKLKALWLKENMKTVTLKINTDGGNLINSIYLEKGSEIILPINPTKKGYIFAGWVDEKGKEITSNSIIDSNLTIKATWKKGYTCPEDCSPIGDGSKCTREITKQVSTVSSCPSGYTLKNDKCIDLSSKYHAISIEKAPWWTCNSSSDYMYDEIDESGLGALVWCVKTTNKVNSSGCPSGYKQNDNTCKKIETISCTLK